MAASVKEKNMPAISTNIYGGLQKWVNRASLSIRERKRSRRNSDVSQTMYKPNPPEINGYQEYSQTKIMPVHGRSRSTPVMIPDQENYLMNIERNCRKTSEEPTVKTSQREALLEPWHRQEFKDDTGRQRKRTKDGGSRTLRRSCSKSESSLIEAIRNSEKPKSASQTAPLKCRVRRTSSQDTEGSLESFTSDLDNNYDMNKKSRSSQASSKANIRDRAQTLGCKVDSNGVKPNEKLRSNSRDKIAKDIKHRLDKWVEKTTGFHDSRQSSFESTSSSDDPNDVILFTRENNQVISNETREMRELQTALEELVSSCGRSSRKNSDDEQTRESIEATNTRASRKVSLKDSGRMFSKAVDIDYHCSQSVQQNDYRLKKCGSSISSTSSSESKVDETMQDKCSYETNSELEESYDSVDGKPMEKRRDIEVVDSGSSKNSMNCNSNIGRGSETTRTLSMSPECLESEASNKSDHVSSLESRSQNEGEEQCQLENWQFKYHVQQDNGSSLNETKQTETNEHYSKQATVGGMKDQNEETRQTKLLKSSKHHHAPPPPLTNANKELQEKKAKKSCDMIFNDVALDAFAEECLRYADKKKKIPSKERESKSDSEEEKRSVKVDFIYIKKDAQSYSDRPVRKKASTHPKTFYDEDRLAYLAFSDNELERDETPLRIRTKRNSADSLDGRMLFNLEPSYDTGSKSKQNIDGDRSIDSLHTEEDLATDNTETGMRKFPSMPLFYIPKDFDSSRELVKHSKSSLRKSIWKRIKRLPRQNDNNRANQSVKSKRNEEDTPSAQFVDPFYHGEKEEQLLAPIRAKAWTLDTTKINRPVLNQRRSAPVMKVAQVMKVEKSEKQADGLLNEYEVIPGPMGDESQC